MAEARMHGSGFLFRGTPHIPDGKLVSPAGLSAAIELELTGKPPAEYARICRWFAQAMAFDRFRWFVRGPAIGKALRQAAERHDLADLIDVEPLPSTIQVPRWTA